MIIEADTAALQQYATKKLVGSILEPEHRHAFEWSIQGLGMLRTYIDRELRLHVWHESAEFEDVSKMHTHPWNFHSLVVAGRVRQHRFEPHDGGVPYQQQKILCGTGGGLTDEPSELVHLLRGVEEVYEEGQVYSQYADEIHASYPEFGTVTLIRREMLSDNDHAYVYWEPTGEWITAEPRPASFSEIDRIFNYALETWF